MFDSDNWKLLGLIVVVMVVVLAVTLGGFWLACGKTAGVINKRCGTSYTQSDIFWAGENIRVLEKVK